MVRMLCTLVLLLAFVVPARAQDEAPVEDSPMQRRDAPPREVLAQLNFGGAVRGDAGEDCVFGPGSAANAPACVLEVAEERNIEVQGFAAGQPIVIQVTRPDGQATTVQVIADNAGAGQTTWVTLPGEPVDVHTVLATQGDLQAGGQFVVRGATQPQNAVVPREAAPGATFQIALAGFAPGQVVPLRLYQDVGDTYWYLADLPPVQANQQGEALAQLATRGDDPEGRFLVVTDPQVVGWGQLGGQFVVTRGGDPTTRNPSAIASDLARATVEQANQLWAAVAADPSRPLADLERGFADASLLQAAGELNALRGNGERRRARMTGPLQVRSAQELNRFRIEAMVTEQWDDQVFNADGSLAADLSGPRDRRYVLELRFEPCYCWLIVDSQ